MKRILPVILFLLMLGCSGTESEETLQIFPLADNLDMRIDSAKTWNDFATSVEIIPLETTEESLLSGFYIKDVVEGKIIGLNRVESRTDDGWILIGGAKADVRLFEEKGRYLRKIDHLGKGEQEYTELIEPFVDIEPLTVKVINNRRLFSYDEYGKWLSTNPVNTASWSITRVGKNLFLLENPFYPVSDYKFQTTLIDGQGNVVKKLFPVKIDTNLLMQMAFAPSSLMRNASQGVWYNNAYSDTLYLVTPEGNAIPQAVFLCGERKYANILELANGRNWRELEERSRKLIRIVNYFTFRNYIYLCYVTDEKSYCEIWEKGSKKPLARRIGSEKQRDFTLVVNGRQIHATPQFVKDNKAYFIIDAYQLLEQVDGITEDSNPVLVVVSF